MAGRVPRINELFWEDDVNRHLLLGWPEPLEGTRLWWQRSREDHAAQTFAIETHAGQLVGACSLEGMDARARARGATLGVWIGRPYWNRGYGTDAVRTLCRFGFRQMNLQRVELAVFDNNPRARRAYEKVGFKEEGRLRRAHFVGGRYVDIVWMGLLSEELIESA